MLNIQNSNNKVLISIISIISFLEFSSSSSSIEYLYSASGALKPQKRYLLPLH